MALLISFGQKHYLRMQLIGFSCVLRISFFYFLSESPDFLLDLLAMNRLKLPSLREIPVFVFQASEGSLVNVSLLVFRISLKFPSEYLHILLLTLRLCHLFLCWYLFCRDEPLVHIW